MSEDTKNIWAFAKENGIAYDTVMAALEMIEFDPKQDIYGILSAPTDSQRITLKSKIMGMN